MKGQPVRRVGRIAEQSRAEKRAINDEAAPSHLAPPQRTSFSKSLTCSGLSTVYLGLSASSVNVANSTAVHEHGAS
jgi:hypothetical protein